MNVGIIGPVFPDSFADNLIDTFRRMGHTTSSLGSIYRTNVSRIGSALLQLTESRPRITSYVQRAVLTKAQETRYDLIVSVEGSLSPEIVRKIRHNGTKVAAWFPDHVANLGRQFIFLADYDLVCLKDSELVRRSTMMLDGNVMYLPEACNSSWHRPMPIDIDPVVVVAGNMYPFRLRMLEQLARARVPLRLYGPQWPRWLDSQVLRKSVTGTYLAREAKARIFRSAGAVLNQLHPAEMTGVNCRLFEAAGCGAAILTDGRSDLDMNFDPSADLMIFSSSDDLIDRARWMLANPDSARRMGDCAAIRAHRDHIYENRLERLLSVVFGNG